MKNRAAYSVNTDVSAVFSSKKLAYKRVMRGQCANKASRAATERNFLIDLIRSEQSASAGQGKLTHFTADLQKLGTNLVGLNQQAQAECSKRLKTRNKLSKSRCSRRSCRTKKLLAHMDNAQSAIEFVVTGGEM